MFTDAEKAVAAKVLRALAMPEPDEDNEDASVPTWAHGGYDLMEDELHTLRSVLIAFAKQHKITADLPDPESED